MKRLIVASLFTTSAVVGLHFIAKSSPVEVVARTQQVMTPELTAEINDGASQSAKFAAEFAHGRTCADPSNASAVEIEPTATAKLDGSGKRVTVSLLVAQALSNQNQLLLARKAELERWNRADQARFATWFGTTSPAARQMIYKRIRVLTLLNKDYSVGNFRRAVPSKPGLFAFVHPTDPSKIFVDQAFVVAPNLGENSRAGTISHEMSHFVLAGGTRDYKYGNTDCKQLARRQAAKALMNADNFEFYVEHVR